MEYRSSCSLGLVVGELERYFQVHNTMSSWGSCVVERRWRLLVVLARERVLELMRLWVLIPIFSWLFHTFTLLSFY